MATSAEMRSQMDAQQISKDLASTVFTPDNDAALQASISSMKEGNLEYARLRNEEDRQQWVKTALANQQWNSRLTAQRNDRNALDQVQTHAVDVDHATELLVQEREIDAQLAAASQNGPLTEYTAPLDLLRAKTQNLQKIERAAQELGLLPGVEQPPQPQLKHPGTFEDGTKAKVIQNQDGTWEARLATGEVFKGDPLDVAQKLADAQVSTKRWGLEWKQKAQTAPPPVQQPQTTQPQNSSAVSFDSNGIPSVDLSQVNDVTRWQFDSMATALGYKDGQEMVDEQLAQRQRTQQLEQQVTQMRESQENVQIAGDFTLRNPDFPGTQEAIEKLMQVMEANNLPQTADNLSMAHNYAVRSGMYQPLRQDDINFMHQVAANGGQVTPNMRASNATPPPAPPRAGSADYGRPVQDAWSMPLDQLRRDALGAQQSGQEQPTLYRR